jgi:hypothetical protein
MRNFNDHLSEIDPGKVRILWQLRVIDIIEQFKPGEVIRQREQLLRLDLHPIFKLIRVGLIEPTARWVIVHNIIRRSFIVHTIIRRILIVIIFFFIIFIYI